MKNKCFKKYTKNKLTFVVKGQYSSLSNNKILEQINGGEDVLKISDSDDYSLWNNSVIVEFPKNQ